MWFELLGFGPNGWGAPLLFGFLVTIAAAVCGVVLGCVIGVLVALAKIRGGPIARSLAAIYTTVIRGIPDLLVIYIVYFGGSQLLSYLLKGDGPQGFVDIPPFFAGMLALGIISGSYQAEVFRGAYYAISNGEIEAAVSMAMSPVTLFTRIIVPQTLRNAIPGLTNVCLVTAKETSLISVVGLSEILRQANIAAGATYQPFIFFTAAIVLYFLLTSAISIGARALEQVYRVGARRA